MKEESKGKSDSVDKHVGKRLKMRRIMLGLSQQDLGEAVNVSIQQIQKYEKATNRISSGRLHAFAKLMSVPVDFFFRDIEQESNLASEALNDESEEFDTSLESVSEKDIITLVRSFTEIKNNNVRKKILDLVKTINDKP